jgi:hypothetical protein
MESRTLNTSGRALCALVFIAALFTTLASVHLAAQGTTGTILGTVTDSSGGTIPDATVRVTNAGTNATQVVTSDAQGRYRVPDLPVGEYQVATDKMGFQSVVHRGITLNAGAAGRQSAGAGRWPHCRRNRRDSNERWPVGFAYIPRRIRGHGLRARL